jgi:glycerate 2-kinase
MPKIQNFEALATTDARRGLLAIAEAGLEAIDTERVLRDMVKVEEDALLLGNVRISLNDCGKIIFIAIGKCSTEAAKVMQNVLGNRITAGVVVDVKVCPVIPGFKTFCGTHPLPSDDNLVAAETIVETIKNLSEKDLVIFAISGGGSTLLFLPEDKRDRNETLVVEALIKAGADIHEMNVVRKHMSLARGGHLAQYAYPARVVSFIFSDVVGDDLSSIASGPTVKDLSTVEDAAKVLAKYDVLKTCNIDGCGLIETPKDDKYFENTTNILAVSNVFALNAMRKKAEELGFRTEIRNTTLQGEAKDVGHLVTEALHSAPPKSVLLWGGETTVTVHGNGRGGRNLALCASALDHIREDEEILSLASDGRDHGPFAGALCDMITKKAFESDVSYPALVQNDDTYALFEKIGNYLMTGDTGSNVSDLVIALKQ